MIAASRADLRDGRAMPSRDKAQGGFCERAAGHDDQAPFCPVSAGPACHQSLSSGELAERMVAHEIPWRQRPPKPLFKTSDAEATAHCVHAHRFPDFRFDHVDLRKLINGLLDALVIPVSSKSSLHLFPS
jgi:hypothetical protein